MSMLTDVQAVKGRFHWGDFTAWRTPGGNGQVSAGPTQQQTQGLDALLSDVPCVSSVFMVLTLAASHRHII